MCKYFFISDVIMSTYVSLSPQGLAGEKGDIGMKGEPGRLGLPGKMVSLSHKTSLSGVSCISLIPTHYNWRKRSIGEAIYRVLRWPCGAV